MDICIQGNKDEIRKKERQTYSKIKFMWLLCNHFSDHRAATVKTVKIAGAVDMNNENRSNSCKRTVNQEQKKNFIKSEYRSCFALTAIDMTFIIQPSVT
jgi:hypothetical protein